MQNSECPICGQKKTQFGGDLKNIATHIKKHAQVELFNKEFFDKTETPHLDYLKKHCEIVITDKPVMLIKDNQNRLIF